MPNCAALLKAIDAYIAKADESLTNALESAGFADCADTVAEISALEENIAQALTTQSGVINQRLSESVDLGEFAEAWAELKGLDNTDEVLAQLFHDSFTTNMPKLATSYIKQVDSALTVAKITKRTVDWAQEWSAELGKLMKLTGHDAIDSLLVEHLRDGNSVADFTRALMDDGIRDEYYRARRAAVTETLRAHSIAQQEAITQNPAVDDKMWKHTGEYRNKPRENHVAMDGATVRKDQPFSLQGADGNAYYPMYPRDSCLPASESVHCHCIHQGIANSDVLGLPLEERQELQRYYIALDDAEWERELNDSNRARAGIE